MFKYVIRVALLLSLLSQIACGGASTPVVTPPPVDPGNGLNYNQMLGDASALQASFTNPVIFTELSQIPMSGVATYFGYFSGVLSNAQSVGVENLLGRMEMSIGFSPSSTSVSGSINDLVDSNNNPLSGQLVLSHGGLDRTGNPNNNATLTARSMGLLTTADGIPLQFEVYLEGDFLGASHDAVGGNLVGGATSNSQIYDFDGYFIGER